MYDIYLHAIYIYIYISSIYLLFFSNEEIKLIWIQDASKFASSNVLGMTTCWICKRLCQGTVWSERKSIGSTVGSLLQGWNGRGDSGSWGRISRFGGEDGARGERSSRWLQGFLFGCFSGNSDHLKSNLKGDSGRVQFLQPNQKRLISS